MVSSTRGGVPDSLAVPASVLRPLERLSLPSFMVSDQSVATPFVAMGRKGYAVARGI